jgi:serine protease Do
MPLCPHDSEVRGRLGILLAIAALFVVTPARSPAAAPFRDHPLERQWEAGEARILRVKPAVVTVFTEVGAEVTLRCGSRGPVLHVRPDPVQETGTGFIIHPDGWIATNGHVVQPVYADDAAQSTRFLQAAAARACTPALQGLPAAARHARLQAILDDPANRQGVRLRKQLWVDLAQRVADSTQAHLHPAVVTAYSPPLDPTAVPTGGGTPDPPMLDAAILKIDATNLPSVRLAPSIEFVHLGEELFIIGYPGVVLWHTFLSDATRGDATVTFGRVSSFKRDLNRRPILQTDTAISWGNSGGPAFNWNDEVVGVATFISTSLDGDQAIQGFNFLIPIDTIHLLASQAGVIPKADGPFMAEWQAAVTAYFQGRFGTALAHVEVADTLLPDLLDVRFLRLHLQHILREHPAWDTERQAVVRTRVVATAAAAVLIVGVTIGLHKFRRRQRRLAAT